MSTNKGLQAKLTALLPKTERSRVWIVLLATSLLLMGLIFAVVTLTAGNPRLADDSQVQYYVRPPVAVGRNSTAAGAVHVLTSTSDDRRWHLQMALHVAMAKGLPSLGAVDCYERVLTVVPCDVAVAKMQADCRDHHPAKDGRYSTDYAVLERDCVRVEFMTALFHSRYDTETLVNAIYECVE